MRLAHDFDDDLVAILALARVEPEYFFRAFLRVDSLYTWQRKACTELAVRLERGDERIRVVVRSCHGAGKTFFAAGLTLWWLFTRADARGLTTAPTWSGVEELLWPQIEKLYNGSLMRELPCFQKARLMTTKLEITDTWYAIGASSDRPANLEGHHSSTAAMRVVDEAKAVEEGVFESTEGLLNAPESLDVWISTPSIQSGRFYERDVDGDPSVIRAVVTIDDLIADFEKYEYPALAGARVWKEDRLAKWGESSPAYRSRAMAEYITESGDQALFPVAWVDRAMAQTFEVSGPLRAGMDVAGSIAGDRNALAIAAGPDESNRIEVKPLEAWHEQDTMVSKGRAVNAAARLKAPVVLRIDANGLGKGVFDQLIQEGKNAEAYRATTRPGQPDLFHNRKAEDAWSLRDRLEKGLVRLPFDPELRADMAAMKWEVTASGKIRVIDPEKSPDKADAVIIATSLGATWDMAEYEQAVLASVTEPSTPGQWRETLMSSGSSSRMATISAADAPPLTVEEAAPSASVHGW